jgi:hypothetical protein
MREHVIGRILRFSSRYGAMSKWLCMTDSLRNVKGIVRLLHLPYLRNLLAELAYRPSFEGHH